MIKKNLIFIFVLFTVFSCDKPKDKDPYKDYYKGTFAIATTVSNTCGLVLRIDSDKDGSNDLATYPINLDKVYERGDTLWIQYKLLDDTFKCIINGGVVGGDFNREFIKIQIEKFK